ncbi:hypothetical protein DM47_766 [Burkholderia mallei]|nr:hypothetical protein DM45_547 [Burkholderia mallei]KOS95812.1 hypothetical protein DM49_2267 [Burkholderia mallei]KOS99386.1 hypothetical protein DM50_923 [Burkholderia mallei]KOT17441.1 hypothetical protein DM47_766 [Burkholderia mallei]
MPLDSSFNNWKWPACYLLFQLETISLIKVHLSSWLRLVKRTS